MTTPPKISFAAVDLDQIKSFPGAVAVMVSADGESSVPVSQLDKICAGQINKLKASKRFQELEVTEVEAIGFPHGCAAESLIVAKIPVDADANQIRRAGGNIARKAGKSGLLVLACGLEPVAELAQGIALRNYSFDRYRSDEPGKRSRAANIAVMTNGPDTVSRAYLSADSAVAGVYAARDLVNEPSNVLTTSEYASRVGELRELGLSVKVLEEPELRQIGMHALLAVGAGSDSPTKVAIIEWQGASGPPVALVGKGVVFDTGGISLKPAAKMEEMTMDMAGSAVVAGVMRTLAVREARANVVGILGLVENMPDGRAQRPGDVVRTLKGDTVEVTNTDAEGRLVLADLLWYIQEKFHPSAMIDLATLTGAIIVGLGDDLAGVFSNNDELFESFRKAAELEGEGAWRMPLHDPYDKLLKSRVADVQNVGGRGAGAVTAAQFLKRFVKPDCPWMHMDIAGVAYSGTESALFPKGATGWGVRAIDRLISERFEVR